MTQSVKNIKRKTNNKFNVTCCISVLIMMLFCTSTFAQHRMRFVQLHGEFLGDPGVYYLNNSIKVSQYGLGGSLNAGREWVDAVIEYDYRKINLENLNVPDVKTVSFGELYLGLRYYSMRPTFMIGRMAIRLTAGALGGFDMTPNWKFLLFGGLAISSIKNTSGVTVNFVYRPGTYIIKSYTIEPSYCIRAGIIIGPSAK